jgi:hypothetical protein
VTEPFWVLDSGALVAYSRGVDSVGQLLVDVADAEVTVAVPLVCLVEAYSMLHHTEHRLLRMLRRNPYVTTASLAADLDGPDDCPGVGIMARIAGRLGAGHTAYLALVNAAGVVTSEPDQIRSVLGDSWSIVEV